MFEKKIVPIEQQLHCKLTVREQKKNDMQAKYVTSQYNFRALQ